MKAVDTTSSKKDVPFFAAITSKRLNEEKQVQAESRSVTTNISDEVDLSASTKEQRASRYTKPESYADSQDLEVKREDDDLEKAKKLNSGEIKSGEQDKILNEFIKLHVQGVKLSQEILSELHNYINNTNINNCTNRRLLTLLRVIGILIDNNLVEDIHNKLPTLINKLDEKIEPQAKELLSKLLLSEQLELELTIEHIEKIVGYYKETVERFQQESKEEAWRQRLDSILTIARKHEAADKERVIGVVSNIFEVSKDSRILEKISQLFPEVVGNRVTSELVTRITAEIDKVDAQLIQEKDWVYFEERDSELISIRTDVIDKVIPNDGGGDCAIYSICDVLELEGSISDIRRGVCDKVVHFAQLASLASSQQLYTEEIRRIKEAYQGIFNNDFMLFKAAVGKQYDSALSNRNNSEETQSSLQANKALLDGFRDWGDVSNWEHIFRVVGTFSISYDLVAEDHNRASGVVFEDYAQYITYASQDGIWLNNHEINGFLLSKGYVFKRSLEFNGTILVYEHVQEGHTNPTILLHNNGTDTGGNNAAGVHWQGVRPDANSILDKYESLAREVDDLSKRRHISGNRNNAFKLLENFIIALSQKPQNELDKVIFTKRETQDKILLVGDTSDNSKVVHASVKLANVFKKSGLSTHYIEQAIIKCAGTDPDLVIELLENQQTLQYTDKVNNFLVKQLIENREESSREKVLELLQKSRPENESIKRILALEASIKESPNNVNSDIVDLCKSIVQNKEKLPYSAFMIFANDCGNQEVREIIKQVVDNELQRLPQFIVNEYIALTRNGINDLSISLFEQGYFRLEDITTIDTLIEGTETRLKALELLERHILKGLKLDEGVKSKLEAISQEVITEDKSIGLANHILKLARGEQDIITQLKSKKLPIDEKEQLLSKIRELSQEYHNPYTVESLLTLATYESDFSFRNAILETVESILPNNYAQRGYSGQILNQVIACTDSLDLINNILGKDYDAELTNITAFAATEIYSSNEPVRQQQALDLFLKLNPLINKDRTEGADRFGQDDGLLSYYLLHCANIASKHYDVEVRNKFIEIIRTYNQETLVQFQIDPELITNLTEETNLSLATRQDLERLNVFITENNYFPTNAQISQVIEFLPDMELQGLASEILLKLPSINISNVQSIITKSIEHRELLNNGNILKLLERVVPYLGEEIIQIIDNKVSNGEFQEDLKERVARILVSTNKEYQDKTLIMLKDCMLSTGDEELKHRIIACLAEQIKKKGNCARVPIDVVSAMQQVCLEKITENKANILSHLLSFQSTATLYLVQNHINPKEFIGKYCEVLKYYVEGTLDSRYQGAIEELSERQADIEALDIDYQSYKAGLSKLFEYVLGKVSQSNNISGPDYKALHSLLDAINRSLYYTGSVNLDIFNDYDEPEWVEELLVSSLIQSSMQFSEEEIDEYTISTFKDRLDALKLIDEDRESAGGIEIIAGQNKKELILLELLKKQAANGYSLEDINDLMGYVLPGKYDLLTLLQSDNFWSELQSHWLTDKLFKVKVKDAGNLEAYIEKLLPLTVDYNSNILNSFFSKINNTENTYEDIIAFFIELNESILDIQEREQLLSELDNVRIKDNIHKLNQAQAEKILQQNKNIQNAPEGLKKILSEKLAIMLSDGWHLNSVLTVVLKVNDAKCLEDFNKVLITICDFGLRECDADINNKSLIDILIDKGFEQCTKLVHDLAIAKTFGVAKEKEIAELAEELEALNGIGIEYIKSANIIAEYNKVIEKYNNITDSEGKVLREWGVAEITQWSQAVKDRTSTADQPNLLYEKCAVIKRAIEVASKGRGREISPRPIQLMSVLIMLNREGDTGRLAQINTGEGKTTIVAMLAAYKALEGHKVDIITSSPELARPQSEQQESFFNLFGLSVAHNGKEGSVDIKERYKADIVYGAAGDFQGDILRDEYSKLGTRSDRGFGIAIVDEVDSMFIDGKNHMVMLSSPMPAMDYLEPVLCMIWQQVSNCAKSIKTIEGVAYYVDSTASIGEDGKPYNGEEVLYPIEGSKEDFIKSTTEKYIRKLLRDNALDDNQEFFDQTLFDEQKAANNNIPDHQLRREVIQKVKESFPKLVIPEHLREFVLSTQLPKWIDSAIHAKYRSRLDQHYVLKYGKVAPVDASNTGVVQANMNWSNGLHQFLQIKHGCKLKAENVTTNFISNVSYFKRYGTNIYGMTGTLGSDKAKQLLQDTYQVDSVIVPTFKKKQHEELVSIVRNTEEAWYDSIIESNINKLENGRAVLVITKYIKEVDEIKARLIKRGYDESKIKLYRTEKDSSIVEQELKSGEIIIATNIAGRGTDINPSNNVEMNGGLHVCITFMPPNERVEQQNVGRTSRTGNKGTSQFIVLDREGSNIESLRLTRDKNEKEGLTTAKGDINKVLIKDEIFREFCSLLDEIAPTRGKKDVLTTDDILQRNRVRCIEEQFGLWLQTQGKELEAITTSERSEALRLFNPFREEMNATWDNLSNNRQASVNPIFYVLNGNILLDKKQYDEAIAEYTKAIELNEHFAVNAYYNRGYVKVAQYIKDGQNNSNQYEEAIRDFEMARRIIEENLEPMLHVIQTTLQLDTGEEADKVEGNRAPVLSEQVRHKLHLYSMQKDAINRAIGIGPDGMNVRKQTEDGQLNLRIKAEKIEQRRKELSTRLSEEEIERQIAEFEKTLEITEGKRNELREKDIREWVRAQKIIKEEAKINAELAKDKENRACIAKKKAFDNFKKDIEATNVSQRTLYSQFKINTDPTEQDIADRKKEMSDEAIVLEKGIIGKIKDSSGEITIELADIYKAFPEDQDVDLYKEEIGEYAGNGFKGIVKVTEVPPIDWWSVVGVAAIGIGQLIAGGALTVFTLGAGSSIGMGLIAEGVSDLITAVKDGIINRDFNWAQWGIQKAISMAVSLVCAGIGAIKDVAKTAIAGVKAIGVTAANETIKAGWKIAGAAIGKSIGKGVAKELVNQLADAGVAQSLIPLIESGLKEAITPKVQEALLANEHVQRMLEIDSKNGNKKYQSQIKEIAIKLISGPEGTIGQQITDYAQQFAEGVISGKSGASQNKYVRLLAHAGTSVGMAEAIKELIKFMPEFIEKLNEEIEKLAIKDSLDGRQESAQKVVNESHPVALEEKQELEFSPIGNMTASDTIGNIESQIGGENEENEYDNQQVAQGEARYTPDAVIGSLSGLVANQMSSIIKGKIVKPLTNMAVSQGVDQLAKGIDRARQEAVGSFQAERRIAFTQDGNIHRIPKKLRQQADNEVAKQKAAAITTDLKNGGEAGLMHMGAISDEINRPIKVFDAKGRLVRIIGEEKGGKAVEVRYEKPNDQNPNGHYTLNKKEANGKYKEAPVSGKNNCLFDVVAAQLDKSHPLRESGDKLRNNTANRLEALEEQNKLAMVAYDIDRLKQYKPNALGFGGTKATMRQKKNPDRVHVGVAKQPVERMINKEKNKKLNDFYKKIKDLTEKARNGDPKAQEQLNKLQSDKRLTKHVRTPAKKQGIGAIRGNGEDEVLKTSETSEWLRRSAGNVLGIHPGSYYIIKGQRQIYTWMDAQRDIRNPTQYQIYNDGSGHSGALYQGPVPNRQGIVNFQAEAHKIRNDAILRSSTPKNAILRGIKADLALTPNAKLFDQKVTKGFDFKDRDMSDPKQRELLKQEYLMDRNRRKRALDYIKANIQNPDNASTVTYLHSGFDQVDYRSDGEDSPAPNLN